MNCKNTQENPPKIYRPYFKTVRFLLRIFTPRYKTNSTCIGEPKVFVCRHLNMKGAITTLKTFDFEVRPLMLGVFFNFKTAREHFYNYTFTKKMKMPKFIAFALSFLVATLVVSLSKSVGAIPVYRNSAKSYTTLKRANESLCRGESVIVFADKNYSAGHEVKNGEIYAGFLYLDKLYFNKTGKHLTFAPLVINDNDKTVTELPSVKFSGEKEYKTELEKVKTTLTDNIFS